MRCKYCKWHKVGSGKYACISECVNENCEYCGDECIEQDRKEPSECEDKEEI